jgi:hypothetical protein
MLRVRGVDIEHPMQNRVLLWLVLWVVAYSLTGQLAARKRSVSLAK